MNDDPGVPSEEVWPPFQWQPVVIGVPRLDEDAFRWSAAQEDR